MWRQDVAGTQGCVAAIAHALSEGSRCPREIAAFVCYTTLAVITLQYPTFGLTAFDARPLGYSLPGLANSFAYLLIGLFWAVRGIDLCGRRAFSAAAACVAAGIVGSALLESLAAGPGLAAQAAAWLCCILTGSGVAVLSVNLVRTLATLPTLRFTVVIVVSILLIAPCLLVAQLSVSAGFTPALGLVLTACVYLLLRQHRGSRRSAEQPVLHSEVRVPWKLAITILFQGLSVGVVQMGLIVGEHALLLVTATGMVLASALAIVAVLGLRLDFNHLMYMLGFPLMALGQLCLLFSVPDLASIVIHEWGYRFIMVTSWIIAVWIVRARNVAACWVWPCIMVAFTLGRFAGALVQELPQAMFSVPMGKAVPVAAGFCALFAALVLFDDTSPRTTWGIVRVATETEEDETPMLSLDWACAHLSKEHGLSPREAEILSYLTRGRNVDYISQHLHLSKDTVKTHRRNIYRKVDVHSQQDLMSLVEHVAKSRHAQDSATLTVEG